MTGSLPSVILSMGDPAGIGPEVALRALDAEVFASCEPAITGSPEILHEAARRFAPGLRLIDWSAPVADGRSVRLHASSNLPFSADLLGRPSAASGEAALAAIRAATDACLGGEVEAMATAPVSKEAIELSGIPFTGHTEWIAERCGEAGREMMLMGSPRLNVAYVTTHVSLRDLPESITTERILTCLRLCDAYLADTGHASRRIAVCGLNPHAGEHGLFGSEEASVFAPAIAAAQAEGIAASGPFPADTIFVPRLRAEYGVILAAYHDQGGIPFKMLSFEDGVNITLGLKVIRASVDHGTAWDLAWKGQASAASMKAAILTAAAMARGRQQGRNQSRQ